jgi:hypothetical protein
MDKSHKSMAKTLKGVASSEPNQKLQSLIYLYSQKHEIFESERVIFGDCEKTSHEMIEEARKLLILPLKVMPSSIRQPIKKTLCLPTFSFIHKHYFIQDIISDHKSLAKKRAAAVLTPPTENKSAGAAASKSDLSDAQFIHATLPLHIKMFEKHRVQNLKALLKGLITSEMRYHCLVVEQLSEVLRDLAVIDEDD